VFVLKRARIARGGCGSRINDGMGADRDGGAGLFKLYVQRRRASASPRRARSSRRGRKREIQGTLSLRVRKAAGARAPGWATAR